MSKKKASESKFNIGIIGLGINGLMHMNGFNVLPNSRVAAICDPDDSAMKRAAGMLQDDSVVQTKDYREVCRMKNIDAIAVCTPTYAHAPIALLALENKKDILLEKPIAPTIKAVDKLIEKAFETDRVIQVGLVYRYCNLYRTVAQMVERGDFGSVMMAYCKEYRDNFPTQWFFETSKSGGALLDKDCHHFDLFSWFIRSRAKKVYAMGGRHVVKGKSVKINCGYAPDKDYMIKNPDIVDHAFVLIEYENKARANLGLCMYEAEPLEGLEIGIIGDNGAHAIAKRDVTIVAGGGPLGEMREVAVDYYYDNLGIGHIGAHVQHVEFTQCMENRSLPYANLLLARDSMVIAMSAELSIEEGREVFIEEFDNRNVDGLLKKYKKQMSAPSPRPLPPPPRKREKKPTREKEIIETFINLVRLIMGKRPLGAAAPFEPEIFRKAAEKLNADQKYLKMAKGLSTVISFKYPNQAPVVLDIKEGRMEIAHGNYVEEATVTLTERGWENLQSGDNLTTLFLSGQIKVEGKLDKLQPYTHVFVEVGKALAAD